MPAITTWFCLTQIISIRLQNLKTFSPALHLIFIWHRQTSNTVYIPTSLSPHPLGNEVQLFGIHNPGHPFLHNFPSVVDHTVVLSTSMAQPKWLILPQTGKFVQHMQYVAWAAISIFCGVDLGRALVR